MGLAGVEAHAQKQGAARWHECALPVLLLGAQALFDTDQGLERTRQCAVTPLGTGLEIVCSRCSKTSLPALAALGARDRSRTRRQQDRDHGRRRHQPRQQRAVAARRPQKFAGVLGILLWSNRSRCKIAMRGFPQMWEWLLGRVGKVGSTESREQRAPSASHYG